MNADSTVTSIIRLLRGKPNKWQIGSYYTWNQSRGIAIWHANKAHGLAITVFNPEETFRESDMGPEWKPGWLDRRRLWRTVRLYKRQQISFGRSARESRIKQIARLSLAKEMHGGFDELPPLFASPDRRQQKSPPG